MTSPSVKQDNQNKLQVQKRQSFTVNLDVNKHTKDDKIKDQLMPGKNIQKNNIQNQKESQETQGKTIKQIESFFEKRYFGNKNLSKSTDLKKLAKIPNSKNEIIAPKLLKLKTGNLNAKMKEIECIFRTQLRSNKGKKKLINEELSEFELYMAKRDVVREKNLLMEDMRRSYEQEKRRNEEKRMKKSKRSSSIVKMQTIEEIKQKEEDNKNGKEQNQTYREGNDKGIYFQDNLSGTDRNQAINNISLMARQNQSPQSRLLQKQLQPSLISSTRSLKKFVNPQNDDYFQRKFESAIIKNSFSTQSKFSIRSLLEPSNKRKTTVNANEFFKNQLDRIEEVAKNTIENFHQKEIINKILYTQTAQSESDYKSRHMSKRGTPLFTEQHTTDRILDDKKSIAWVLKECQNYKKNFKIRKSKSLKPINKIP